MAGSNGKDFGNFSPRSRRSLRAFAEEPGSIFLARVYGGIVTGLGKDSKES